VYRRVHFEPVPGTLACADFPAAVSPAGIYTMETLISLSGAAIGKMLACAEPEVAKLAIGPAHPVFYGFISGGVHPAGQPFVATNADNMIGSPAASPTGDGVDFGGHFCPVTGLRVDSEIIAEGGEALHDIVIGEPAGFPT
jgi:N-methylhydantoinase B